MVCKDFLFFYFPNQTSLFLQKIYGSLYLIFDCNFGPNYFQYFENRFYYLGLFQEVICISLLIILKENYIQTMADYFLLTNIKFVLNHA